MFRIAAWLGALTVALALGLTFIFPSKMGPLPQGMRTPIIAFELARSVDEVETMFGAPESAERAAYVRAMDRGNYQDFAFLVLYGLFFMALSRALIESGSKSAQWGRWLASLPSAMDAMENVQLLAITRSLGGDYAEALSRLQIVTWAKWIGIALIFATWIPALWSRGVAGRVTAGLATFTLLATITAFFTRGVAAELMALGVGLTVLGALTFAYVSSRRV